ncbi:biotin transporter BioY [Deinococcus yavapaiensis]|uniref:Biotin transporter n=1 Tax=Deinococcus yavapaiensis KR-236 TaxID=694435 RepID=A0A318S1P0_9DEIO|nr:biotin transporter BioY [Deinococcus yavapaiensis]PYE48393.1 biotin transport system substrate-specific component [Deinococcus yavapaiensis KR-236]
MKTTVNPTLIQTLLPRASVARDVALVVLAAAFVALLAQVEVPIKPVPITLQTLGVLLVGAALGSKRGAAAIATYLAAGAVGLPVLAGGAGGLAKIFGPTGGFLIGFIAAAFVVGWLVERLAADRKVLGTVGAMIAGNLVIYAFGLPWLALAVPALREWSALLAAGFTPFLLGDALKLLLAAALLPSAWAFLGRR